MKHYEYTPSGICAKLIEIDINDDGTVGQVAFHGGCDGNHKGIASLVYGMKIKDVAKRMRGVTCGMKRSSCPDQLALALEQIDMDING